MDKQQKQIIERLENIIYLYNRESRGWHDCNDIRLNSNDIKAIEKAIELIKAISSAQADGEKNCLNCKHQDFICEVKGCKDYKKWEQADGDCNTCEYNTTQDSGECYECVKGIRNHYKQADGEYINRQAVIDMNKTKELAWELGQKLGEVAEDAYKQGYSNGIKDGNINDGTFSEKVNEAYNNGLNDAWEAAREIVGNQYDGELNWKDLEQIFGSSDLEAIFSNNSASEAIHMIREYKEWWADEIKVGDEVICKGTHIKKVVMHIAYHDDNTYYTCINEEQGVSTENDRNSKPVKTGRHFPQITEVLKQMEEG